MMSGGECPRTIYKYIRYTRHLYDVIYTYKTIEQREIEMCFCRTASFKLRLMVDEIQEGLFLISS